MKKQILIAIALLGTVVACKKEESKVNETPVTETPAQKSKKVLTSQTWKVEALFLGTDGGPFLPLPMDPCEKDDYIKFTSDDKQIFYAGATKCDPSEPDSFTKTYKLNAKGDSLTMTDEEASLTYGMTILANGKIELIGEEDGLRIKMALGKY
jgi:hypothetical protein